MFDKEWFEKNFGKELSKSSKSKKKKDKDKKSKEYYSDFNFKQPDEPSKVEGFQLALKQAEIAKEAHKQAEIAVLNAKKEKAKAQELAKKYIGDLGKIVDDLETL